MSGKPVIRCAIYTRKSSEEGLDQAFNALDAQHEACAAYIASQKHEGWRLVPTRYDDGGLSGGSLERPGLQRLLSDIAAGRVAMVVVYKIDRLTRSLADFARLVERFDAAGCSFVSVTQAFNTASSMGRLTLNVLLSFAQFEREVTAERIRDKIAASKKRGLWMGGLVPLGYDRDPDPQVRGLVVNAAEAEMVRTLFILYDSLGCLRLLEAEARHRGMRSKPRTQRTGRRTGNAPLTRGMLHHLLTNPIYRGQIRHHDRVWPGQHPAIVDADLWARVQARLTAQSARKRGRGKDRDPHSAPLVGRIEDAEGDRLTPTHAQRHGRRYRYYVSSRLLKGPASADPAGWRLPAPALEAAVGRIAGRAIDDAARTHRLLADPKAGDAVVLTAASAIAADLRTAKPAALATLIDRVRIGDTDITVTLSAAALGTAIGVASERLAPGPLTITVPFAVRRRGVEARIVARIGADQPETAADPTLHRVLCAAHGWLRDLRAGTPLARIAADAGHSENYVRTRLPLALLSPRLQLAILDGTVDPALTVEALLRADLPSDWRVQEDRLAQR